MPLVNPIALQKSEFIKARLDRIKEKCQFTKDYKDDPEVRKILPLNSTMMQKNVLGNHKQFLPKIANLMHKSRTSVSVNKMTHHKLSILNF